MVADMWAYQCAVAEMIVKTGKPISVVSADINVPESEVRDWVVAYLKDVGAGS